MHLTRLASRRVRNKPVVCGVLVMTADAGTETLPVREESMLRSVGRVRLWFLLPIPLLAGCLAIVAGLAWLGPLPPLDAAQRSVAPSTFVYDRDGRLLYEVVDQQAGSYRPVPLEEIPLALRQAIVATEDATFYTNPGVDLRAIARSLWINLTSGEIRSGASTITQQAARNLLMGPEERAERSWRRKAREAVLAWRLTRSLGKDAILALYLNETYFGNMAYGVEAAARIYLGKPVAQLDLAECALLAGLPQSPAQYNPLTDLPAAKARQRVVLDLMVAQGMITPERADLAYLEELALAGTPFPIEAPHATMLALQQAGVRLGEEVMRGGGLRITTTLDLDVQRAAEAQVRRHLGVLNEAGPSGPGHNVHNAAVVVLDPDTGGILAMVGSPDYFDPRIDGAVNGALALRQPGSSIKPLTYAAAFEQGNSPATVISDVPTSFVTHEGRPYTPVNYDYRYRGPTSLRVALASSYNVVAVRLLDRIGVAALAEMARRLGITSFQSADRYGLALTLGGGEVQLLQLAAAYGAFANGGLRVDPVLVARIETADGRLLYEAPGPARQRVLDERVAWLVTDVLADPMARLPAFGASSPLNTAYGAAVKTGTTTEWRDNWTVGYTRNRVVGVWVGNADNSPMKQISGVTGAAPIWQGVMNSLHPVSTPPFGRPEGLVERTVCADSGLLPGPACTRLRDEWFLPGNAPQAACTMHRLEELDAATGRLAGASTPPERRVLRRVTYWPADALLWAEHAGLPLPPEPADGEAAAWAAGDPVEGAVASHAAERGEARPRLASPVTGSAYCLAADIAARYQQVEVVAVGPMGVALTRLALEVDGVAVHTWAGAPYRAFWPLAPGAHVLRAVAVTRDGTELYSEPVQIMVRDVCD